MSRVECFHPSCHCSFASQAYMLQHYTDRHVLQDQHPIKTIACNDCGKLFRNTDFLHQHQWDSADHIRVSKPRVSKHDSFVRACLQCGDKFGSDDHLEEHFLEQHPLIKVAKSSEERRTWQLVAERFISSCNQYKVHHIFKVYNTEQRRNDFEEFRQELKKEMANKRLVQEDNLELRNQVLQDGNEMLRYHGTTVKCRLGRPPQTAETEMTASLCASTECNLCCILQKGFKKSKCKEDRHERFGKGIYFSSISSKASGYVKGRRSDDKENYKVMMVCKVLVGRPHIHSTRNFEEVEGPAMGYHSVLLGDPGVDLNYDELLVYDDRAILPAFIILYSASSPSRMSDCQRFLIFLFLLYFFVCVWMGDQKNARFELPTSLV